MDTPIYQFGKASTEKLGTCDSRLAAIARVALSRSPYDITIVWGGRGRDIQNALYDSGASHKQFPHSKHNTLDGIGGLASEAIDFAPWVDGAIPWDDTHIFAVIAGLFYAAATELGQTVRWGGDWDTDGSTQDQTLMDYGHIEIML